MEIYVELRCRKSCRSSSNMGKRQRGPELKHSTLKAMRVRHMDVRCEYQTQDNSCQFQELNFSGCVRRDENWKKCFEIWSNRAYVWYFASYNEDSIWIAALWKGRRFYSCGETTVATINSNESTTLTEENSSIRKSRSNFGLFRSQYFTTALSIAGSIYHQVGGLRLKVREHFEECTKLA